MRSELVASQLKEHRTQVKLPEDLKNAWDALRARAIDTAIIDRKIPDFIRFDWVNRNGEIDQAALKQMSEIAAGMLRFSFDANPTHIVGIAESGIPFTREVAKAFGLGYSIVYKAQNVPDDFDPNKYNELVAHSYTLNKDICFYVPRLPEDSEVIVTDDVIAFGGIGNGVCEALNRQDGVVVAGMATSFDKVWQGGVKKIEQQIQVPVVSVIRIAGIKQDRSGINLMPEEESLSVRRF